MEKSLSLTYDEVTALLDMSLLTYADVQGDVARSAIRKLSDLCRQFDADEIREEVEHISPEIAHGRAA